MVFVPTNDSVEIRDVWSSNLDSEFVSIREITATHRYIGMDTEYPGVVIKPPGEHPRSNNVNFTNMIENVNATKIIQLGLTFMNDQGFPPRFDGKYRVWQFNFRELDIEKDRYVPKSIDLVKRSGIDLNKNRNEGVDACEFSQLLMTCGAVLRDPAASDDSCKWLTFQGGFHFGYLLKMLRGEELRHDKEWFLELMNIYFGEWYDAKHVMMERMDWPSDWRRRLDDLAWFFKINRVGQAHQAGSDSLLTACVFMAQKKMFLDPDGHSGADRYMRVLQDINNSKERE
ncbi:hypothetical protein C2S52_010562 [Perilla frutescens var. hirtella]|nr:hypothetical protein C2S52_010562 [Perilla frutescens var. hirtella]